MITIAIVAATVPMTILTSAIICVRRGIAHEESDRSLLFSPDTRTSAVTRRVVGFYVRTPRGAAPINDRAWATDHPLPRGRFQ